MKKGTKIKQHDITDCGAACLASVCAHYGLRFPVSRIRQYAFTDQKGTNVLGLIEAANKLGLSAKGVRAQFDALYTIPKPTIAHVLVNPKILKTSAPKTACSITDLWGAINERNFLLMLVC